MFVHSKQSHWSVFSAVNVVDFELVERIAVSSEFVGKDLLRDGDNEVKLCPTILKQYCEAVL